MLLVGKRKAIIILVLISLFILVIESCLCSEPTNDPQLGNWDEVIRFEGENSTQTELFTIDYVDWRIRWEYDPGHWHFPEMHKFQVITYLEGSSLITIDMISGTPGVSQNGTSYLQENPGRFYMKIGAGIIESYTIVVEQNLNSIPEFPALIILPLFLMTSLTVIIFRKKCYINNHRKAQ